MSKNFMIQNPLSFQKRYERVECATEKKTNRKTRKKLFSSFYSSVKLLFLHTHTHTQKFASKKNEL